VLSIRLTQSLQFLETNISQGSVTTPLSVGWICSDRFIANFLPSVTVKNVENRSIFGEDVDKSLVSCFLAHGVVQYRRTMINTDHVCIPLQLAITKNKATELLPSFLRSVA